jgi:hypothetical protein
MCNPSVWLRLNCLKWLAVLRGNKSEQLFSKTSLSKNTTHTQKMRLILFVDKKTLVGSSTNNTNRLQSKQRQNCWPHLESEITHCQIHQRMAHSVAGRHPCKPPFAKPNKHEHDSNLSQIRSITTLKHERHNLRRSCCRAMRSVLVASQQWGSKVARARVVEGS